MGGRDRDQQPRKQRSNFSCDRENSQLKEKRARRTKRQKEETANKKVEAEKQAYVRKLGIGLAIFLRISLPNFSPLTNGKNGFLFESGFIQSEGLAVKR